MAEFVTFEISKKLKEKGYPQLKKNTLAMYNEVGEWFSLARYLDVDEYCFDDFDEHDCVAPTISQVLKWFRDEKKLYIMPYNALSREYNIKWDFEIDDLNTSDIIYESRLIYKSYEEAAIAGIEYVINNLI